MITLYGTSVCALFWHHDIALLSFNCAAHLWALVVNNVRLYPIQFSSQRSRKSLTAATVIRFSAASLHIQIIILLIRVIIILPCGVLG